MERRTVVMASGAAALVANPRLRAQGVRVMRLGSLTLYVVPPENYELTVQALKKRGWEVGRNLTIEARSAGGDLTRLPALARELVDARVDVIYA